MSGAVASTSAAPPVLSYGTKTYLVLSTPPTSLPFQPPTTTSTASPSCSALPTDSVQSLRTTLTYVGPVGALSHEHLYSLDVPTQDPVPREVEAIRSSLREMEGVTAVEVMALQKPKSKRWEG